MAGRPHDGADESLGQIIPIPGRMRVDRTNPLDDFTLSAFLTLDAVREADPVVLAGAGHLDRQVRWLRTAGVAGPHDVVQEGELLLVEVPRAAGPELARRVDVLMEQAIAGVLVQPDDGYVPEALVRHCEETGLPLVVLRRRVPFVRLREEAHSAILVARHRLVEAATRTHQRFDELGTAEAPVEQLVAVAGELAGCQVVFADLLHHVHAYFAAGSPTETLLDRWQGWAQDGSQPAGTHVDSARGLAVTPVLVHGQRRADLAIFAANPPAAYQVVVLTRAATAIGARMLVEHEQLLGAQARGSVLDDIVAGRFATSESVHARTAALGHPTRGRLYLPLVLLSTEPDTGSLLAQALDRAHVDGLTVQLAPGRWSALLLCRGQEQASTAGDQVAAHLTSVCRHACVERGVLARGSAVDELSAVRASFSEAVDVALAAHATVAQDHGGKPIYSVDDIQLRGLLHLLRDEPRVQGFVERSLGPLLTRDAQDGGDRVRTLASYLRHRGNKSTTAHELQLSRQTLYERLGRIERLLGVDLDDPESSASLFAAVMVVEEAASTRPVELTTSDAEGLPTLDRLSRSRLGV